MLKKFLVHEQGKEPVGELLYDTDTNVFTLRVTKFDKPSEMPLAMELMLEYGKTEITDDVALCFVRERLIPPNRANIADILAFLKMPYYDECLFLEKLKGRCVMDDFLITPENEYYGGLV